MSCRSVVAALGGHVAHGPSGARRSRAVVRAVGLVGVGLVLVGGLTVASPATPGVEGAPPKPDWTALLPGYGAPAPPALQALRVEKTIYFEDIQVPEGVEVTGVDFAPDFKHWILGVKVGGASQLAVMMPNGDGYQCLTCGLVGSAKKQDVLEDGKRIWFANTDGQESGAAADFQWSMLECAPSIYRCATRAVLPVDFPIDSISTLPQGAQNREATPDPDGEWVSWNEVRLNEGPRVTVARIVRRPSSYALVQPRVVQPQYKTSDDVADWVHGARFYEGGRFIAGNRYLKYQTTRTASNYDTGLLDLATGRYRFMTRDLDYNETGDESPDGRWYSYSSARGLDRMDVFTQLVRPPLLDMTSFGQVGRVGLFSNRRCMNEAWLMDFHGQRPGGYAGQPLLTADNWLARKRQWFPDSKHLMLTEQLLPNVAGDTPEGRQFRLRIVSLPGVEATRPLKPKNLDEVDWSAISVPADKYTGMASRTVPRKVLKGRKGGRAILEYAGTYTSGSWSVRYQNYSDDGLSFVSGTESIKIPFALANSVWTADLKIRGRLNGRTKGTLSISPQGAPTGDVSTTINGKTWSGVPTQEDCPGMHRPRLRVATSVSPDGRSLIVTVRSRVPEDRRARPVQRARVIVGGVRHVTSSTGRTRFPLPGNTTRVVARAGGFATGTTVYDG